MRLIQIKYSSEGIFNSENSGVQSKNNEYHIVDKVQISYENTLIFNLIDNVAYVVFALYSRIRENAPKMPFMDCFG